MRDENLACINALLQRKIGWQSNREKGVVTVSVVENSKKHPPQKSAADYARDVFLTNPIASATDATGITPTLPQDESEAESYCSIADIPVTATDGSVAYYKAK